MAASTWWKDESGTCARTCRELSVMPGASAAARSRRAAPRDKAADRGGRFLAYWAEIGLWPPPRDRARTNKKNNTRNGHGCAHGGKCRSGCRQRTRRGRCRCLCRRPAGGEYLGGGGGRVVKED